MLQNATKHVRHSYVWQYFNEDVTNSTVKCQLCTAVLKYNTNASAMRNHLKMKHPLPTASTSSNASTSEQRTGVSSEQRQTNSKKTRVNSDADDELRDYCQRTPHIPTMDNPLEWWAENVHRFPRFRGATWLFQPQAPRVRGFFPWQATLSPESGQASFPHMSMRWCSNQKYGKVDVIVEDSE